MLAVAARQEDNTVTVLDLASSVPQLTVDANMKVSGLRVIGNIIVTKQLESHHPRLRKEEGFVRDEATSHLSYPPTLSETVVTSGNPIDNCTEEREYR